MSRVAMAQLPNDGISLQGDASWKAICQQDTQSAWSGKSQRPPILHPRPDVRPTVYCFAAAPAPDLTWPQDSSQQFPTFGPDRSSSVHPPTPLRCLARPLATSSIPFVSPSSFAATAESAPKIASHCIASRTADCFVAHCISTAVASPRASPSTLWCKCMHSSRCVAAVAMLAVSPHSLPLCV
jgi:hypothetical protein